MKHLHRTVQCFVPLQVRKLCVLTLVKQLLEIVFVQLFRDWRQRTEASVHIEALWMLPVGFLFLKIALFHQLEGFSVFVSAVPLLVLQMLLEAVQLLVLEAHKVALELIVDHILDIVRWQRHISESALCHWNL